MYNNGQVAAIHYNSFRKISNTDVYLVYETIAGRKKNEKIGHYQAIVKGLPCPTNITTPEQNQHVPQANNKPPLSTETCNQNPNNQHDEYDDEDIVANLHIPPMQTRPKDVADICHKQMSEEKELWTVSPMKTNHVSATFEKSLHHHSRKLKQKRLFLHMLQLKEWKLMKWIMCQLM